MRLSRPIPRATSWTSASTASHRFAISLMKLIFTARKALAAYLVSSAVRRPVNQDRRAVEEQRPVDFAQHVLRAIILGADDDAVGMLEVGDGRAFAQEFGVRGDRHVRDALFAEDLLDLVAGPDRHGGFGDNHGPGFITLASSRTASNTKVRSAWPSPRLAGVPTAMNTASAPFDASGEVGREGQPPALGIGLDQRLEPRLPDRHPAGIQAVDLRRVLVDAADAMAEIGKAGPGNEPDIAGADHRDTHALLLRLQRGPHLAAVAKDEQAIQRTASISPETSYIGAALPMNVTTLPKPPRVGLVSLGCPKDLVDSERIMTKLRADGYDMSPDYAGADVVLVNTCGFLDSAKEESLEAIGEAIAENGRVVVTGCMGKEADVIRERFPDVLAITGPQQYEEVVAAVHEAAPPIPTPSSTWCRKPA